MHSETDLLPHETINLKENPGEAQARVCHIHDIFFIIVIITVVVIIVIATIIINNYSRSARWI